MRAAQILAEMLLHESRAFAIVYGPGLPEKGYYAVAPTEDGIFAQVSAALKAKNQALFGQPNANYLNNWLAQGYTVILHHDNESLTVYGQPVKLTPQFAQGMQLNDRSPVTWYHFVGNKTVNEKSTAGAVLGVTDTQPDRSRSDFDDEVLNRQRASGLAGNLATTANQNRPPVIGKHTRPEPPIISRYAP